MSAQNVNKQPDKKRPGLSRGWSEQARSFQMCRGRQESVDENRDIAIWRSTSLIAELLAVEAVDVALWNRTGVIAVAMRTVNHHTFRKHQIRSGHIGLLSLSYIIITQ